MSFRRSVWISTLEAGELILQAKFSAEWQALRKAIQEGQRETSKQALARHPNDDVARAIMEGLGSNVQISGFLRLRLNEVANKAVSVLGQWLVDGELAAMYRDPIFGSEQAIPLSFWESNGAREALVSGLYFPLGRPSGFHSGPNGGGPISFTRADVEALLRGDAPAKKVAERQSPPAVVSDRTGAPGHPSSKHLVEAELRQRLAEGRVEGNLAEQSEVLADWLGRTHPGLARMKGGSIENAIRTI